MTDLHIGTQPCTCKLDSHSTRLIALTGGPGAGKTAVLEMASRAFCRHVGVLPEAASIVFGGGFPRHESEPARRAVQRAIFHVQRQVERLVIEEGEVAIGLCDRGTIDGLAYWPGPSEGYWQEVGTSLEDEITRYAAVIHLETPDADSGYNHDNALRIESAIEARAIDNRIADAWHSHPRRFAISSTSDFIEKAVHALKVVRDELPRCCQSHPLPGPDEAPAHAG